MVSVAIRLALCLRLIYQASADWPLYLARNPACRLWGLPALMLGYCVAGRKLWCHLRKGAVSWRCKRPHSPLLCSHGFIWGIWDTGGVKNKRGIPWQCSESKRLHSHLQGTRWTDADFIFEGRGGGRSIRLEVALSPRMCYVQTAKSHLFGLLASYGNNFVIKNSPAPV